MTKKSFSLFLLLVAFFTTNLSAVEETLSIIKPNAVADRHIGEIISRFEKHGLQVAALKMARLTKEQTEQFYAAHKQKPFFRELVTFMTSGPVVVMVLKGDKAVEKNRNIMGATDPKKAAKGTIRADFSKSITANAVHGSDSVDSAKSEIAFFFSAEEIQ